MKYKFFDKLKSIYYILTKHYYLIWRDYGFPKENLIAHLLVYEDVLIGDFYSKDIPKEVIECLKSHIESWEKRNAKNI